MYYDKKIKKGQLFINGIRNIVFLIFCLCCGFTYAQDKKIIYLETIYIEDPIMVKSELIVSGKEYVNMFIVSKSYFQDLFPLFFSCNGFLLRIKKLI